MNALLGASSALTPTSILEGFTFTDTINTSLASYDVATAATAVGWNGTSRIFGTITQAASGEITGPFPTGTLPGGSSIALTIENTAFTRGSGGDGGTGGVIFGVGAAGATGGTAIDFKSNGSITVDAGGEVSSGGGGGGGGGAFFDFPEEGYGGGGGGGFPDGAGGTATLGGTNGSAGTSGGGGAGGAGGGSAGAGGAGGNTDTAGAAGTAATFAAGAAGAKGSAIEKNGFTVVITNNGSINGNINA